MDWDAIQQETIGHLRAMIRINTVNPPGNELAVARYLDGVFKSAGIEAQVLEATPERGAIVARLRGSGARQPILLLAHMDVVAIEPDKWSVEPFGGDVRDGYLYGRGAIDDKGMLATNLMAMLLARREIVDRGGALGRDVIFLATADEEAGSTAPGGIVWMLEHHADLIRAEFVLNEGGRVRIVNGKRAYVAVQTAEKAAHTVKVTARGPAGHASVPLEGNAILRLARALGAILGQDQPVRLVSTTERFFAGLAPIWPDREQGAAMEDLASGDRERVLRGSRVLARVPALNATLRIGISPTMIAGGIVGNVIPAEAHAMLNVRTLPGDPIDGVIERLRALVGDSQVDLEVTERGADAPESEHASPMFQAIADSALELDPELTVVPYMSTGGTDSAKLRAKGFESFGLLPFPMDPGDEGRMHGHDERVPLVALDFGTRLVYGVVRRMVA